MNISYNRSHMKYIDERAIALFAGVAPHSPTEQHPDGSILRLTVLAVGRNGWRCVREIVDFQQPYSSECKDILWDMLDHKYMTDSGRVVRISKILSLDVYSSEAVLFHAESTSGLLHIQPVVSVEDSEERDFLYFGYGKKDQLICSVQLRKAEREFSLLMPGEIASDSAILAYCAEFAARNESQRLDHALRSISAESSNTVSVADVTIVVTSPDGHKTIVSHEIYAADVIDNYLKMINHENVLERLQQARLRLDKAIIRDQEYCRAAALCQIVSDPDTRRAIEQERAAAKAAFLDMPIPGLADERHVPTW